MRLFKSKHEKEMKGVAKNENVWKSAKKASVDFEPQ